MVKQKKHSYGVNCLKERIVGKQNFGDTIAVGSDLVTIFLELPFSIIQRADLSGLQPTRNAVEVKGMVTHSPCNSALITGGRCLVRLTFNAQIHYVIATDSTVVNNYVPSPQGNRIPLLYFKTLLFSFAAAGRWQFHLFFIYIHC